MITMENGIVTMNEQEYFDLKFLKKEETNPLENEVPVQNNILLSKTIPSLLADMGVPCHVKGYNFIKSALRLILSDSNIIHEITKKLYPAIAKEYDTTPSRTERAIRHAIEISWLRANKDTQSLIFGYSVLAARGKPTNSEFLAALANHLRG